VREGQEDVGAGGCGQPQAARQQAVVEEDRALVVERRDDVDRIDHPEGGVGDQLAGLDPAGPREEAARRPVRRELGGGWVGVAHGRAEVAQLPAGDRVRRPVLGVVGALVAAEVPARRPARAERVHVAEQVVAVLDAGARDHPVGRPGQIGAGGGLEQLAVVDQRGLAVARHEVGQVQPLAALHARGVLRRADQVAAVVHVDVQVAAVPAVGGRVEQARRAAGDLEPLPGGRGHLPLGPIELEAAGAGDHQWLGGHRQGRLVCVEERPVMVVPLGQHPVGEPGPPLESVTDQRTQAGAVSSSSAAGAGRAAPSTRSVRPPSATVNAGSAPSSSIRSTAAPPASSSRR
jgi:hypothetical protein